MEKYTVYAFAEGPGEGNGAGVIRMDAADELTREEKQQIAAAFGFSETAFLSEEGENCFALSYFTPTCEVPLCGHATVAAFSLLYQRNLIGEGSFRVRTKEQEMTVLVEDGFVWMEMEMPSLEEVLPKEAVQALCRAYGLEPSDLKEGFRPRIVNAGIRDIHLVVKDHETLMRAKQDVPASLAVTEAFGQVGVHMTALAEEETEGTKKTTGTVQAVTAYCSNFGPAFGIEEECATGTASAGLSCYLDAMGVYPENGALFLQGEHMGRPAKIRSRIVRADGRRVVRIGGCGYWADRPEAEKEMSAPAAGERKEETGGTYLEEPGESVSDPAAGSMAENTLDEIYWLHLMAAEGRHSSVTAYTAVRNYNRQLNSFASIVGLAGEEGPIGLFAENPAEEGKEKMTGSSDGEPVENDIEETETAVEIEETEEIDEAEEIEETEEIKEAEETEEIKEAEETEEPEEATKQAQWEKKLLDLSLRNMLINLRLTKTVVPLLAVDAGTLEDALTEGEEFQVLPRPDGLEGFGKDRPWVDALGELGVFAEEIIRDAKRKKLYSAYTQTELTDCQIRLYRSARTSMEENGANTLYLALGLLRWYEDKKCTTARYAPIVLVPIEMIRKSAARGYTMRMRDEDAQINITLLAFLQQNYEIRIPGLNPPPQDEHGLDLAKIFGRIREEVESLPGWTVLEAGLIGNFSFSQFVMWNDIHSRSDFLEGSKLVRSLMTDIVDWDCTIPEEVETDEAYLPVAADSSQLRAINMAAAGVSFVLHGPPGTGKSQTITGLIANALTRGKTVLFVAEKRAALEVVQKRLAALGIQDFCLELHSNKATKKAVLDQLRRGLEIGVWGFETEYETKIQEIRKMRSSLDAYGKALHAKRPFGLSLRQMIDVYETIPKYSGMPKQNLDVLRNLTKSDLERQVQELEQLVAAGQSIGHPCGHPLSAVRNTEYSQRLKYELTDAVGAYKKALEALMEEGGRFAAGLGMDAPKSRGDWERLTQDAKRIIAAEEIPDFLRGEGNLEEAFAGPAAFLAQQRAFAAKEADRREKWNENFLRMDMEAFRMKYDAAGQKLFGKGRALAAVAAELQAYAAFPVQTERIPAYLTDVAFLQQEKAQLAAAWEKLGAEWQNVLKTCPTEEALLAYRDRISCLKRELAEISRRGFSAAASAPGANGFSTKAAVSGAGEFLAKAEAAGAAEAAVGSLLMLDFQAERPDWMEEKIRLCDTILTNSESVKDWIVYRNCAEVCRKDGLAEICDLYEQPCDLYVQSHNMYEQPCGMETKGTEENGDGSRDDRGACGENGFPHEELIPLYLRTIYRELILAVIESEPALRGFSGTGFNRRIAQFKKMDQEFMELTKDEMFYHLTHQLPLFTESPEIAKELNILRRAIRSNGRGLTIRALFDQIPHILPRLCPCMLMSPISAAQYLKAENDLFDLVVFDEASQLPTCKAVGVLARGKNAVIVGDPNQMPPTSFFAGNMVDEENLDIEDLDSILDDCLALGMPQTYLQWHYRSRHESLIAFSNQEFYENAMCTFPSVNDRRRCVRLKKVDGVFDRGGARVNEEEAKAIVEEIRQRYQDESRSGQSIGVVTFNIQQQTLIEDLLLAEYRKDAAFDKWANAKEERLFVKNLENVQGDERDVILFSVAFGPDPEGKMTLNFGPINKDGGWKRLNVAVTRARAEMMVFASMTADRINLNRTKARGVEALRDFLLFAEKGTLPLDRGESRQDKAAEEGIRAQICEQIEAAGFKCQKAVGHSRFRLDLAVVNPENEEEYLLGIMLDGESYRQTSNTRDREIAQIGVLEGLGWKLHRIWTMDWWDGREKEVGKVLNCLQKN